MQQLLTEEGYQRLEIEASRYNDICTILKKLKENGFFKALYDLIFCIFASEHDFTIKMLSQMQKQKKGEGFKFNELYRINSGIFCNNFQLINKIIIDDIFLQFTSKVSSQLEDYEDQKQFEGSFNSKIAGVQTAQNGQQQPQSQSFLQNNLVQDALQQQQQIVQSQMAQNMVFNNLNDNLNYIIQHHPEIDVTIQQAQSKKVTPRTNSHHTNQKPISMQGTADTFNPQGSQQIKNANNVPKSHSQSMQDIQNKNNVYYQNDQGQLNSSVNGVRHNQSAGQQQQNQSITASQQKQPRFYQQNIVNNAALYSHSPPNRQPTLHNNNSQMRMNSLQNSVQLNNNNPNNFNNMQLLTQQFSSPVSQRNQMNNSSYSATGVPQNHFNSHIQTSPAEAIINSALNSKVYLPYSEFSYTKGGSFSKSSRKLHDIQNNPGVGQYETGHKKSSSSVPFNKQEKKTIFEKKNEYDGTLFYPSHHFVAKPPQINPLYTKQ